MIELIDVTKLYPGQAMPAVNRLSLKVERGETCVFVGPSGCGKSTTVRMINRMIEPTSGTILIDNQDVRGVNPDKLRMDIGYVIQQIGLLPHRTVGENIAIVPRLHGWARDRIDRRVNELLELIGLDPETTRNKYPSQLSGGQMQRVGVARAMAADPPIMLMDEPFGAVDPIARNHLQDEFLRLQRKMKKTICFVTHDINEAIKMGDKIAVFNRGQLVQLGTPYDMLCNPVDDFVLDFVGGDRVVKMLSLFEVRQFSQPPGLTFTEDDLPALPGLVRDRAAKTAFLLDRAGAPLGFLTAEELADGVRTDWKQLALQRRKFFVQDHVVLRDALSLMLEVDSDYLGVLSGPELAGVISLRDIREHAVQKEGL